MQHIKINSLDQIGKTVSESRWQNAVQKQAMVSITQQTGMSEAGAKRQSRSPEQCSRNRKY